MAKLYPSEHSRPSDKEVMLKFTVEFGENFRTDEDSFESSIRDKASQSTDFLQQIFLHIADEAKALTSLGTPEAEATLKRMSSARTMQCAYYGHGSCPPTDDCMVCCWYDNDPEPWCWCEDC